MTRYTQSPAGAERDRCARFHYFENLTDEERGKLRRVFQPLLERADQMGEVSMVDLAFVLAPLLAGEDDA